MCAFLMTSATPFEFALLNGAVVTVLDLHQRRRLMCMWREKFASSVMRQTGRSVHLGFDWHAFSYGFTRSKHGLRGLELYLAEAAPEVYVVPEDEDNPAFACRASALLDFSSCHTDVLVFPVALSWTMAFTHEQPELGPYFSRAEWCELDP
ncbi:MAG TPA: DUF4275 family protein, partial [Polyangiaceae bacterium]|nr:DUF4275 family protein [Polyangiaceae bacterium]